MALSANIKFKGIALPSAYIRVDRVFGGKKEGWNSVVGVYASSESAETESPLETFNQLHMLLKKIHLLSSTQH